MQVIIKKNKKLLLIFILPAVPGIAAGEYTVLCPVNHEGAAVLQSANCVGSRSQTPPTQSDIDGLIRNKVREKPFKKNSKKLS